MLLIAHSDDALELPTLGHTHLLHEHSIVLRWNLSALEWGSVPNIFEIAGFRKGFRHLRHEEYIANVLGSRVAAETFGGKSLFFGGEGSEKTLIWQVLGTLMRAVALKLWIKICGHRLNITWIKFCKVLLNRWLERFAISLPSHCSILV